MLLEGWCVLVLVLFTTEDQVPSGLRHIVGGVYDLSCAQDNVRMADLSTLVGETLTGSHHLTKRDTHLCR